MVLFLDLIDPTLPDLHMWSLFTGFCAGVLVLVSLAVLLWKVVRASKVWGWYSMIALLFCIGCWSLLVAFQGYNQWVAFEKHLPFSPTADYLIYTIGPSYWADVQRCQVQFGIILVVLVLAVAWWLLARLFLSQRELPH